MGLNNVAFVPARNAASMPAIGPKTSFLLAQPFLSDTARALEGLGATYIPAAFPLGAVGTTAFFKAAAEAFGISDERFRAATEAGGLRAEKATAPHREALAGKRIFFFPDSQLEVPLARFVSQELGMELAEAGTPYLHKQHLAQELGMLGSYSREFARPVREAAQRLGIEALITDDYLDVAAKVAELQPELVLGTQMERHIAKRLGVPCAVISAPVHVQDFPARYSPQMGFEGANVIFDTWVHPLMMGLEEHLIHMFRYDFEFNDKAGSSHISHQPPPKDAKPVAAVAAKIDTPLTGWAPDAEKELQKVPFFVRGKARRNTERYAAEHHMALITVETLYDAKAHYSR